MRQDCRQKRKGNRTDQADAHHDPKPYHIFPFRLEKQQADQKNGKNHIGCADGKIETLQKQFLHDYFPFR